MKFWDTLKYAGTALRTRKGRTFLTTLGIVIGIAAIVSLLSLSQGFQNVITSQFQTGFSTRVLTVTSTTTNKPLYLNDSANIEANVPNVVMAAGIINEGVTISENNITTTLYGVDFDNYSTIFPTIFTATNGSIPHDNQSAAFVIGSSISKPYNNDTTVFSVGNNLTITWAANKKVYNYTNVVGAILPTIGSLSFMSGPGDTALFLPDQVVENLWNTSKVSSIAVLLNSDSGTIINDSSVAIQALYSYNVVVTTPHPS